MGMKRFRLILTALLLGMIVLPSFGQTVGYTHKPLGFDGCQVRFNVAKVGKSYSLIVTITSEKLKFLKQSTMMLKTFDGDVIKLDGGMLDTSKSTDGGFVIGDVLLTDTKVSSTAQFDVTPEQFELLKKGVAKIRLLTIPKEHEHIFDKDKIGEKIYQLYQKALNKEDKF